MRHAAARTLQSLVLGAVAVACARSPAPEHEALPYVPPLADAQCRAPERIELVCHPQLWPCTGELAACDTPARCLDALARDGHECALMWPEPPGQACTDRIADVLAGGGASAIAPILHAMASGTPSVHEPGLLALERMPPAAIDALAASDHALVPLVLARLGARRRAPEQRERLEQALARHVDAVLAVVVRDPVVFSGIDQALGPALAVDPERAMSTLREALSCAPGRRWRGRALLRLVMRTPSSQRSQVLRQVIGWPDWELQLAALGHLAADERTDVALLDSTDVAMLERVAAEHWSPVVRRAAEWNAARLVAPTQARTRSPAMDDEYPTDRACRPDEDVVWHVSFRGQTRAIPMPDPQPRPPPPSDAPEIEVVLDRETITLPRAASAVHRMGDTWFYGTSGFEGSGSLYAVDPRGDVVELRDEPVDEIVATPSGVLALLEPSVALLEVDADGRPAARHLVRLPDRSHGHLLEPDGTVVLVTSLGVVALDPAGGLAYLPCAPQG
jgi:hypothetical protein